MQERRLLCGPQGWSMSKIERSHHSTVVVIAYRTLFWGVLSREPRSRAVVDIARQDGLLPVQCLTHV